MKEAEELLENVFKMMMMKKQLKKREKDLLIAKTDMNQCVLYKKDKGKYLACIKDAKDRLDKIKKEISLLQQKIKEHNAMKENIMNEMETMVDFLLDDIGYSRPYDAPKKMRVTTGNDDEGIEDVNSDIPDQGEAEDEDPDKVANSVNNVPNQDARAELDRVKQDIGESYSDVLKEESGYQKYFQSMLSKYGVKSPKDLPDDKKKEFFDAVDKGWKGKKETD